MFQQPGPAKPFMFGNQASSASMNPLQLRAPTQSGLAQYQAGMRLGSMPPIQSAWAGQFASRMPGARPAGTGGPMPAGSPWAGVPPTYKPGMGPGQMDPMGMGDFPPPMMGPQIGPPGALPWAGWMGWMGGMGPMGGGGPRPMPPGYADDTFAPPQRMNHGPFSGVLSRMRNWHQR